jgi:hypothetical protein
MKLQFCRIHRHEAEVRVRVPGCFNLSGIDVDSSYLQTESCSDFTSCRANAAPNIQIPPRGPDIDSLQQSSRAMRDLECMPRTIDEMLLERSHFHAHALPTVKSYGL